MKSVIIKCCISLLLIVAMPGCWNSEEIESLAYITVLGIDYKDGEFIAYMQVLNFSNVAKSESAKIGEEVPVWIGKGTGKTLSKALSSIYATSQIKVSWGHLNTVVLSEGLLNTDYKIDQVFEELNRYREIRYNMMIYGTREPLTDILAHKSLLNLPVLDSVLISYDRTYKQRSYLAPTYSYRVLMRLNEPGRLLALPTVSIKEGIWKEDEKDKGMFRIDGAFVSQESKHALRLWFSEYDLKGVRWLIKKLKRSQINAPNDQAPVASFTVTKTKPKVKAILKNGKVYFEITIKAKAYLNEMLQDMSVEKMAEELAEAIKQEIIFTYNKGIAAKADLLDLNTALYRTHPKVWHEQSKEFNLDKESLHSVKVKVNLVHTGKYKGRVKP